MKCREKVHTCGLALEVVELLVAIGSGCQLLGLLQLVKHHSRYTKPHSMTQLTDQRITAECERIVSTNDRHIWVASVAEFQMTVTSCCPRIRSESLSLQLICLLWDWPTSRYRQSQNTVRKTSEEKENLDQVFHDVCRLRTSFLRNVWEKTWMMAELES